MTQPQLLLFAILAATIALFVWGKFRHDMVALAALLACVSVGLVPGAEAFAGFGHPAVITVACVLVLSRGLQNTGAVDWLARNILPRNAARLPSMAALTGLGAALSSVMNNVGAMALLMPIAVKLSARLNLTKGQVLMPLAFCTILGGMATLVGTPPNLVVSGFRSDAGLGHFAMFDFAPVGVPVAFAGVVFISIIGWKLVPARRSSNLEDFETSSYLTEIRIPPKSKAIGMTIRSFERDLDDSDAQVYSVLRDGVRIAIPHGGTRIRADDVLLLQADVEALAEALSVYGITLEQQVRAKEQEKEDSKGAKSNADKDTSKKQGSDEKNKGDDEVVLREVVVLPGSNIVGLSARDMWLRTRYGLNLLAVSRHGKAPQSRLRTLALKSGDVLLLQGPPDVLAAFINETGCVPLSERNLRIPDKRMAFISAAIMIVAIVLVTFGLLSAAVAFAFGVLASMLFRTVPPRQVYTVIDWPVIVLLGALIPVAGAMQTTGAAELLALFLVDEIAQGNAIGALAVLLITTMLLSDVMNNAATAAVLCPIALGVSHTLGVNPDSFLMAVAIGASCALLTPIAHQNNTLILGPGGFGFSDYWKLGLPLEIIIVAIALPLLLIVWPL